MILTLPGELDTDMQIRLAAMEFIASIWDSDQQVRWADLMGGFDWNGERINLVAQSGIFRPRQLRTPGAALTIRTSPPNTRYESPYDDQVDPETDLVGYRYRSGDRAASDNEALRLAGVFRRPLIWFYGLEEGIYQAEFPVWVVNDDPDNQTFQLSVETGASSPERIVDGGLPELKKRYVTIGAKRRLHQSRFRRMVLRAYGERCAVCSLGGEQLLVRLLDAAHIREDKDEQGHAEVPNGLALCKIHHTAYDSNILGISPGDRRIHVRQDILEVVDGPILSHGIQGLDSKVIRVPRHVLSRPKDDYLEWRYNRFRAA